MAKIRQVLTYDRQKPCKKTHESIESLTAQSFLSRKALAKHGFPTKHIALAEHGFLAKRRQNAAKLTRILAHGEGGRKLPVFFQIQ